MRSSFLGAHRIGIFRWHIFKEILQTLFLRHERFILVPLPKLCVCVKMCSSSVESILQLAFLLSVFFLPFLCLGISHLFSRGLKLQETVRLTVGMKRAQNTRETDVSPSSVRAPCSHVFTVDASVNKDMICFTLLEGNKAHTRYHYTPLIYCSLTPGAQQTAHINM